MQDNRRKTTLGALNSDRLSAGMAMMDPDKFGRDMNAVKAQIMEVMDGRTEWLCIEGLIRRLQYRHTRNTRRMVSLALEELTDEGQLHHTAERWTRARIFLAKWEGEDLYTTDPRIAKAFKWLAGNAKDLR